MSCRPASAAGAWWWLKQPLPLAAPGIASAGLLGFIFAWNNFVFALILAVRVMFLSPVGPDQQVVEEFASQGSGPYGLDPFFKRRARQRAIARDGRPALVVHAAVADHLEVLRGVPVGGVGLGGELARQGQAYGALDPHRAQVRRGPGGAVAQA